MTQNGLFIIYFLTFLTISEIHCSVILPHHIRKKNQFHSCSRITTKNDHHVKHIENDYHTNKRILNGDSHLGYRRIIGDWTPIKFQVFRSTGVSNKTMHLVYKALEILENRIQISPINTEIQLPICPNFKSTTFTFKGHMAIWVYTSTTNSSECSESSGTVAYSYNCYISPVDNRPITGFITLCPIWEFYDEDKMILIILHEIFHLLGFSKESFRLYPISSRIKPKVSPFKFTLYPDERGTMIFKKLLRKRKIGWFGMNGGGVNIKNLGLDKSVRLTRDYFKCDDLNGIELSNDGSHLSKLFFFDSFMSPIISGSSNINCLLSYTILEESGWYLINKTGLVLGTWMKNAGCEIFKNNCLDYWVKNKNTEWFCFDSAEDCAIAEYEKIPKKFIYDKTNPSWGGLFGPEMEFCMIKKKFID